MPTPVELTVDTGGTGDYTSLSACISAQVSARPNLVSNDENLVITCTASGGAADTTPLTINGFTTDATRNILIKQSSSGFHKGIFTTSYYRLQTSSGTCLTIQDDYVIIDGLQINQLHLAASVHDLINITNATGCHIRSCFLVSNSGNTGNSGQTGVQIDMTTAATRTVYIYNNVVFSRNGITVNQNNTGQTTAAVYNNGILSSEFSGSPRYGIRMAEPSGALVGYVKNNYMVNFGGFSGVDYSLSSITSGSITTATNTTNDNTSPQGAGYINIFPAWQNVAGLNVNLTTSDTTALNRGTDLSTDASGVLSFPDDAKDFTRTGSWDIGPLELEIVNVSVSAVTATSSVQAPIVAISKTVEPSVLTANSSVQAPTIEVDDISDQLIKPEALTITANLQSPSVYAGILPAWTTWTLAASYDFEIILAARSYMATIDQNFTVTTGDNVRVFFPTTDAAGDAYTLTGATIRWKAAKDSRGPALISKSTGLGITLSGTTSFYVELLPADTVGMLGAFYHEAELTDTGGNVVTIAKGTMTVERGLN